MIFDIEVILVTDGHYLVAGDISSSSCSWYNYHSCVEAIFETAKIEHSSNICHVSFSHYGYSIYSGTGNISY